MLNFQCISFLGCIWISRSYPPGNQHIPPWLKENHLQNSIFGGYVSSLEGKFPIHISYISHLFIIFTEYFLTLNLYRWEFNHMILALAWRANGMMWTHGDFCFFSGTLQRYSRRVEFWEGDNLACLLPLFVCLFVCLFACLLACLLACLFASKIRVGLFPASEGFSWKNPTFFR